MITKLMRRTGVAALAVGAMVAMAACSTPSGDNGDNGGDAETPTSLRIAFGSSPDFTAVANFKWIEDLEAQGIEVEELYFESSQDAFRALVAGEADVAPTGIVSAIRLNMSAGENVKVIANDLQAPSHVLLVTPDINSDEELVGKQVGISTPGDISDSLTRYVFGERGIDVDGVNFVEIGGTNARIQALISGQISGGIAHAAEGLTAVKEAGLKDLYSLGEFVPDYLQHGLMATQDWLDENNEFAQMLVDGFIDATRWAAEDKEGYIELSKKYIEGLDDEIRGEAYDIFKEVGVFAVNGGMDVEQLENTVAIEESLGSFEGQTMIGIDEWADRSYVENYLERNGRQ